MDFNSLVAWFVARGSEPSTWRGLIGLVSAVGVVLSPHQAAIILAFGVGLAGFLNVVTKDPKNVVADVEAAVEQLVIPVSQAINDKATVAAAATVAAMAPAKK